ncbi:DNA photolyase family protein [Marinilongibacter aquaticus]|uniref:cryptochrome/photolyase family protein n=1 Tax=Marinilongibacter aquaticus TaxID=2975157 RepID=UPI0021BDDFD1|nr:deoxyribodipyrimidine photo-lyase [Marinilongibacter aquaticus]UBM59361.1 DNA photolyase family protein [Marinilongibacter aquaticus]
MKMNIFWFRRDLRLHDNAGLSLASHDENPLLLLFIFDEAILSPLPKNDARVQFIHQQLEGMHAQLAQKGKSILIKKGDVQSIWKTLCEEYDIEKVYFNKDYEPDARKRDKTIWEMLKEKGIEMISAKDQVIFERHEVLKADNTPYTVFTPYKRKWLEHFTPAHSKAHKVSLDNVCSGNFTFPSLAEIGFDPNDKMKVKPFQINELDNYAHERDFPAKDAGSYLGPHLRFGTVSVREILRKLGNVQSTFASELIWREFFMQILFHFPDVINRNFHRKYDGIEWRNDEKDFALWCEGQTGYPLVDAGMRELNETGYMHNRVRMLVASFLCKHLLIDWQWGEAYFAEKLLDYELASNNGNWQWAAGTGCDAAPYFRVFNPSRQQEKFDKNGLYIKKWVPEFGTLKYAREMVEHSFARQRALEAYKAGINKV